MALQTGRRWSLCGARVAAPGAMLCLLVVLAGCRGGPDAAAQGPPPGAGPGQGPSPVVEVVLAERGALTRTMAFTGEVLADRMVELTPLESGQLVDVSVDEGETVRAGAVLARLDDDVQDRRRREADAARRAAQAQVAQAVAERDRHAREVERRRRLQARDALPRAELEALEDQMATLEAAVAAAQAREAEASTALGSRRTDLERRRVVAPFDGLVVRRLRDPGAAVSAQQPVVVLVDPSSLEFVAQVPEHRLSEVEVGARASIALDAAPEQRIEATLRRIGSLVDRDSRTVELRFGLEEGPVAIRHGMFGRGRMTLEQREASVLVPDEAVHEGRGEGAASEVWVVREARAEKREVEVIHRLEGRVAVRGVDEGEQVIVSPVMRLQDGQSVRTRAQPVARPGARR